MNLRPFACWDCGFDSGQGHGCLSVVSVVCCLVEVSATGRSLVQRSPAECGVSEYDREAVLMRSWLTGAIVHVERRFLTSSSIRSNVTVWWSSVDGVLRSADRQSCHELRDICTGIEQICAGRQAHGRPSKL